MTFGCMPIKRTFSPILLRTEYSQQETRHQFNLTATCPSHCNCRCPTSFQKSMCPEKLLNVLTLSHRYCKSLANALYWSMYFPFPLLLSLFIRMFTSMFSWDPLILNFTSSFVALLCKYRSSTYFRFYWWHYTKQAKYWFQQLWWTIWYKLRLFLSSPLPDRLTTNYFFFKNIHFSCLFKLKFPVQKYIWNQFVNKNTVLFSLRICCTIRQDTLLVKFSHSICMF